MTAMLSGTRKLAARSLTSFSNLTDRHVRPSAHKGVGHGVYKLSAHSKVTQLDLTTGIH